MFNQFSRLRLGMQHIRNLFRRSGRHLRDSLPTLQTQEIASIKSNLSYRHYKPGVEIIQSGDLADNFYVIIKGRVEILDRKHRSLSTLETGDFFGEIGLLEDGRRSASIRSL
ncbi:MAG: cyclic nucleotide-binding domain-containing protein, partial [Chloroflexota bacterium]